MARYSYERNRMASSHHGEHEMLPITWPFRAAGTVLVLATVWFCTGWGIRDLGPEERLAGHMPVFWSGLLLAGKLLARPAKAQPALETHQPLAAVAKNGDDRARPKLWMLDGRADAWGVNHSPIHHSPINSASSRRRCLDFGSRRLYVATSSTR